jgi:hypothetical protein
MQRGLTMIYETDPKKEGKVLKVLQKKEKALEKHDRKGNVGKYVSTCLDQAQNYFKIYKKEQCIEKLNQAAGYCQAHPNVDLKGDYPFQLIPHSNALGTEIEKLYGFYFTLYNKFEELKNSQRINYWSQCTLVQTQEDAVKKTGTIIPIPFLVKIKKQRQYLGIFSHIGWVFATDNGISFLLTPTVIKLISQGSMSYQQTLKYYCAFPEIVEHNINRSDIVEARIVEHIVPRNKTSRIYSRQGILDIMIYNNSNLNILNLVIRDHKEMGIDNLTFRPDILASTNFSDIKKKLQKEFVDKVQSMKTM